MWFHPDVIDEAKLDDEVDAAVAPYKHVVPPHVLQRMKETLRDMLLHHPDMAPLTRAALPAKEVERSGDISDEPEAPEQKKPAAGDDG